MIVSYDMYLFWTVAGGQDKGGTSSHLIDIATYLNQENNQQVNRW